MSCTSNDSVPSALLQNNVLSDYAYCDQALSLPICAVQCAHSAPYETTAPEPPAEFGARPTPAVRRRTPNVVLGFFGLEQAKKSPRRRSGLTWNMAPSPLYNGWPYNGVKWGQHKAIEAQRRRTKEQEHKKKSDGWALSHPRQMVS